MRTRLPRIESLQAEKPATVHLAWRDGGSATVDLHGWIVASGVRGAELKRPETFMEARIGHYGTAIVWGDEDGDLAIDAVHLERLAELQRPFTSAELRQTQELLHLSNIELASMLGVGKTAFAAYRNGSQQVPLPIAISVRAIAADPTFIHALRRPSAPTGRPGRQS